MNMPILRLDPEDVTMAMSDQQTEWMLDPATGKLCMDPDDADFLFGSDEAETWAPADPDRVLPIPDFDSSDGYRLMQTFALEHADEEASKRLQEVLKMRKPFRRFKDALGDFPELRRRWYEFEAEQMKRIAEDFYEAHGYAVRWTGPSADSNGSG